MADRPTTSRVGRPRTRSVHQTPHAPSSKVGRPRSKSVQKPKAKESAKKTKWVVRPILQLDWDIVVVDWGFPVDQLPALPPIDLDQGPQLNPPNQPIDLQGEEVNQHNQHEKQKWNLPQIE